MNSSMGTINHSCLCNEALIKTLDPELKRASWIGSTPWVLSQTVRTTCAEDNQSFVWSLPGFFLAFFLPLAGSNLCSFSIINVSMCVIRISQFCAFSWELLKQSILEKLPNLELVLEVRGLEWPLLPYFVCSWTLTPCSWRSEVLGQFVSLEHSVFRLAVCRPLDR